MVDYSRAAISKSCKESFDKAATNVIDYIKELQDKYEQAWMELETFRKERAAIIEKSIQTLKNAGVKLNRPLGRCNNEELNNELLSVVDELPFAEKEEIQTSIIRINNRYHEIVKRGKILDELSEELSNTRVLENDAKEEVIISLSDYKKKKESTTPKEHLDKVEKISKASEATIVSLNDLIKTKKKQKELPKVKEESKKPAIIEESDLVVNPNELGMDTDIDPLTSMEIESLTEDDALIASFLDGVVNGPKEKEVKDYYVHEIKGTLTLAELVKKVYGDSDYWKEIYNYGNNKGIIDRKAAEFGVTVEEAAFNVGCLTNVKLQFPTEIIAYEEIEAKENKKSLGKAA